MPPTVTPPQDRMPHAHRQHPGHSSTATTPSSRPHTADRSAEGKPATPEPPAGDPRPRLDHPPPFCSSGSRRRQSHAKGPGAHAPRPIFCTNSPPFLHLSSVATGTARHHQPHKKARSTSSAIPRQITSAHFATVTAPFLRFSISPRHCQQTPFRPFYRPLNIALLYPQRSYPDPCYPAR